MYNILHIFMTFNNENKWLSDFDILEHIEHLQDLKLNYYTMLPHTNRKKCFDFYEWVNKRNMISYDFDDKPLYFFEHPNFKFKIFLTHKHFVCVLKYDNCIEYFNSNMFLKDHNIKQLNAIVKKKKYHLVSNNKKYQMDNYSCGHWCLLRCYMHHLSLTKFNDILEKNLQKYSFLKSYDDVCHYLLWYYYGISFNSSNM